MLHTFTLIKIENIKLMKPSTFSNLLYPFVFTLSLCCSKLNAQNESLFSETDSIKLEQITTNIDQFYTKPLFFKNNLSLADSLARQSSVFLQSFAQKDCLWHPLCSALKIGPNEKGKDLPFEEGAS